MKDSGPLKEKRFSTSIVPDQKDLEDETKKKKKRKDKEHQLLIIHERNAVYNTSFEPFVIESIRSMTRILCPR